MSENKQTEEIKEYAEGWITERKGTDVPIFLKVAYIIIAGGAIAYFFMFMYGEVNHSSRGKLVQAFNEVTQSSPGLMYLVVGLMAVYAVILALFVFRKFHED